MHFVLGHICHVIGLFNRLLILRSRGLRGLLLLHSVDNSLGSIDALIHLTTVVLLLSLLHGLFDQLAQLLRNHVIIAFRCLLPVSDDLQADWIKRPVVIGDICAEVHGHMRGNAVRRLNLGHCF